MRVLVFCGLLLLAGVSHADNAAQRQRFLKAYTAAQKGNLATQQAAVRQLEGYPLYYYLPAAQLEYRVRHDADKSLDKRIRRFIEDHPELPPTQQLRRRWLVSLAHRKRWQLLIKYTHEGASTAARCRVAHARIALGQKPRENALQLWNTGRSAPKACDPVFAWLKQQGALTPDVILERARLALLAGHYHLVRYLAGRLPDAQAARADHWLAVAQAPSRLATSDPVPADIVIYAFKRLALSDTDKAASLVPKIVDQQHLDGHRRYQMRRYIALLYAEDHDAKALEWFARIDHRRMEDDEHVLGWQIRAAIYNGLWSRALAALNKLPPKFAHEEEWRYWSARALAATGHKKKAHQIYAALAQKRSYHGYLAADALGRDYSFNARPLALNKAAHKRVESRPALARARELHKLGMVHAANREWRQVTTGLNKTELAQAARIAFSWDWYSRAIITLAKSGYWDDLNIRYPYPYRNRVKTAARTNHLDPAFILAIMRTESLFRADARSSAGAVGLMQIMPGTARHVARNMGRSASVARSLNIPAISIPLGAYHLRTLLNRWHGNIALATASYNAGPRKVLEWLPDDTMPADIWIANIPYTETREYVQRAMSHMTVFQHRYGGSVVPVDRRLSAVRTVYAKPDNQQHS